MYLLYKFTKKCVSLIRQISRDRQINDIDRQIDTFLLISVTCHLPIKHFQSLSNGNLIDKKVLSFLYKIISIKYIHSSFIYDFFLFKTFAVPILTRNRIKNIPRLLQLQCFLSTLSQPLPPNMKTGILLCSETVRKALCKHKYPTVLILPYVV